MSLRTLCTCCLMLLLAGPAAAQDTSDGSLYTRFGLGELQSFASSQIQAMGGSALGLPSYNYVNFANPATWSNQVLTRLSVSAAYQGVNITNAEDEVSRLTSGALNAVQFSFPILDRRLGVGFAFDPYSRVNYRVQREAVLPGDAGLLDSTAYRINYEGGGGLQQIVGGLGYRLNEHLSLGASAQVVFGIIENRRRTSFVGAGFEETNLTTATRLAGVTGRFGAMYYASSLFGDGDLVSVGATFTLPTHLSGDRVVTLGQTGDIERDTLGAKIEGAMDLPMGAGLGLSYSSPKSRWLLSASGQYEPWSAFSSDFELPGYTPEGTSLFRNRIRTAAGVEFLPAGTDLLAPYFARTAYRLGFYYDQAYVAPTPEVDLRTVAVTGGLSLPTMFSGTRLDVNVEVGTRGTTEYDLVRDVFYKVTATVNIGERWFQKQKLR